MIGNLLLKMGKLGRFTRQIQFLWVSNQVVVTFERNLNSRITLLAINYQLNSDKLSLKRNLIEIFKIIT